MSSSAGWIRVFEGARLVASAMAKEASSEASVVTSRATQHGMDLTSKACASAQSFSDRFQNPWDKVALRDVDERTTSSGFSSSTPNPYESQLRSVSKAKSDSNISRSGLDTSPYLLHSQPNKISSPQVAQDVSSQDASKAGTINDKEVLGSKILRSQSMNIGLTDIVEKENDARYDSSSLESAIEAENQVYNRPHTGDPPQNRLQEGVAVPASRVGRAFGFASLGVGLAFGTVSEIASRTFSPKSSQPMSSPITSDANSDRLAVALCRMRGAALKMGQMLSIQDESLLPPALSRALHQVRQGADAMPNYQLLKQLESQLGKDWRDKFESFDETPFAAASIGQVHRATIRGEGGHIREVVVKVQYPGVAQSIESDLKNLSMLVTMTGLAPKGLFIENVIRVGRDELKVECNYINEMANQRKFKELVESDPVLVEQGFVVPEVIEVLTTSEVITSQYVPGGTIDKVSHLDQEERNRIGRTILYLTMKELFEWRLMQTDPNWGNFLYDVGSETTSLIDFGATREYSKEFVDGYLRIVWASANRDEETLMAQSRRMEFLTGDENDAMVKAHKLSGFTVGEPFWTNDPFDFKGSNISTRMGEHTSVFLQHRLTAPPEEVYTLHRKLAGAYMLCIKLGAVISCRDLLEAVVANHVFEDGMDNPILKS